MMLVVRSAADRRVRRSCCGRGHPIIMPFIDAGRLLVPKLLPEEAAGGHPAGHASHLLSGLVIVLSEPDVRRPVQVEDAPRAEIA